MYSSSENQNMNFVGILVTYAVEPGDTLTNTSETDVASAGVWKRPITGI